MSLDPAKLILNSARPALAAASRWADANRRISKLERRQVNTLVAVRLDPWTAPSLVNSWANEGAGSTVAGYYIDAGGFVHLKGAIKVYLAPSGSATTPPPLDTLKAFVLPVGYRPAERHHFSTPVTYDLGYQGAGVVIVNTNGDVIIDDLSPYPIPSGGSPAPNPPDTVHVNLDGMNFRA